MVTDTRIREKYEKDRCQPGSGTAVVKVAPGVGDSTQTLLISTRTRGVCEPQKLQQPKSHSGDADFATSMKKRARGSNHGDVRVVSAHVYHGETALAASGLRGSRIAGRKEPWGTPTIGSHKTGVVPTENIQNSQHDI